MTTFTAEDRATIAAAARIRRDARKAQAKARSKSPKADRGRERDNGFLAYVRRQPCEAAHMGGCSGPVQAAHIRYRVFGIPNSAGGQVKNHDRHCNPLCDHHHNADQHKHREQDFWASIGKDAYATAAAHFAAYSGDDAAGHDVIRTLRAQGSTQSAGEG